MPSPSIVVPWSITGALFVILLLIFLNPEKAQIWSSHILGWFASTSSFIERNALTGRIQGTVNQFAKGLDKEGGGILPYSLKIDWVRNADREALLKQEGLVIVRLGYSNDKWEKALAAAMLTFCSKALIPSARPYLSRNLLRSIDFTATKKMLTQSEATGSVDYFVNEILRPEIEVDNKLCQTCQTMDRLDDEGYFSRVVLRELQDFGRKLYPRTPEGMATLESEEFISFITQIVEKAPEEDVGFSLRETASILALYSLLSMKL